MGTGLCITYSATDDIETQLIPKEPIDKSNHYKITLSKTGTTKTVNYKWSAFNQASGWGENISINEILEQITSIEIGYTAAPNSINSFKITAFGKYGTCGD